MEPIGVIAANPFRKYVETVKTSKDWHYVPGKELGALLDAATDNYRLMIALCRLAGLRRMEAYWLEWSDVNFGKNMLYVVGKDHWQPKDYETRVIPIVPELMSILTEAFNKAEEGAVRVCPAVCVDNIDRDMRNTIKRAGLALYKKPLHSLRKSGLTDFAGKYPLHVVKEIAGHANISTTETFYLKVTQDQFDQISGQKLLPEKRTHFRTHKEEGVTTRQSHNA